jgi:hypothetical protein
MALKSFTAKLKLGYKQPNGENVTAFSFGPNYGSNGREVNKEWASSTPGLQLQMSMKNELADQLTMGDEFTVTFMLDEKEEEVTTDGGNTSA